MNHWHRLAAAVLAVLALQVAEVGAIECYVCQSEIDKECEAAPPAHFLKNCSSLKNGPNYIACRKVENWVDFVVLNQQPIKRIIRQCAADVDKDRPCYYRAGFGGRANNCDCFEDRCNSASLPSALSLVSLAALMLLPALLLYLLRDSADDA